MTRKRRKLNNKNKEKKPKLKDPDPISEDYIYDDVEQFHRSKDKILLDPTQDVEESHLSEEEHEEVLGLGESDDDEDEDEREIGIDADGDMETTDEDEDNKDDGLPDDKAWGKHKNAYYDADVQGEDVEGSDEEAELAAEEEELEAMTLQKRMAEKLDAEDFYTFDEDNVHKVKNASENLVSTNTVTRDLSKLSKREKLEILVKESPELLPMLDEYEKMLAEVKDIYHPLLLLSRKGFVTTEEGGLFVEAKHQLLMNYLVNLSFYLALKASKDNVRGHPIIDVLAQHKQLLEQLKRIDKKLAPEIEKLLLIRNTDVRIVTAIKKNDKIESEDVNDPLTNDESSLKKKQKQEKVNSTNKDKINTAYVDPLKYYNLIKSRQQRKRVKKLSSSAENQDDAEDEEEFDKDGKRKITYEMAKNKGLTRKRRKELKNPRVKHKMKYRKAKIKHKGQVRELQREMTRYGGETTGIKTLLSRSIKIN